MTRAVGIFFLSLLISCGPNTKEDKGPQTREIGKLVHAYKSDEDLGSLRAVVVITEQGCLPCNRAFSNLIDTHLNDPSLLIWVSAMGTSLDISAFKANPKQVIWDYDQTMQRSGLIDGSGVILLRGGAVDTVITLDARSLDPTLAYVSDVLDKQIVPGKSR